MAVDVHLFRAGHCRHSAWFVDGGQLTKSLYLPAMVAVIRHPQAGVILFDTGYGKPLLDASSLAARIYRRILPFEIPADEAIPVHLESLGLNLADIKTIFLSHFHPDHIGSLRDLPGVPILHSSDGLAKLRTLSGPRQAKAAFFPELMPDDFAARARSIEALPLCRLPEEWKPFTEARDITGDQTLLAVPLPGHALGQFGLLCQTRKRWAFLVADAAWTHRNIEEMAMPGWPAGSLIGDPVAFRATLEQLHELKQRRPGVLQIPSHCEASISRFQNEQ